ncbi:oligoribonuclease [Bacillus sp. FJAT-45350]|uniref:oligoribonuclease n=1 Tax=Bacillus sp. FJAT-45350 TaxID=2011014 RepID=UPI000BB9B2F1|nr:oligoribonuclease [Bacillus sp. FJAT-45350]
MTNKKSEEQSKEESKYSQEKKTQEPAYSKQEILATPSAFGVGVEVLAGALHGLEKTEFTKVEVKEALENFKKKKVK